MRVRKPDVGYKYMRKLTSREAKLLKCDHKTLNKLLIMTEETGMISFWLSNSKTGKLTLFTGSIYEYFDTNQASATLEEFWAKLGLS